MFVPSLLVYIWNDQLLPLKSQMFVSIGHAYFYLMGVAFYSYSSFQPGRLQWTNFVSWGRNILPCMFFEKRRWNFVHRARNFSPKINFRFSSSPRSRNFADTLDAPKYWNICRFSIRVRKQTYFLSSLLSVNTHTDIHTYIFHVWKRMV